MEIIMKVHMYFSINLPPQIHNYNIWNFERLNNCLETIEPI